MAEPRLDKKNQEKDLQDAASAPVSEQENDPEENAADSHDGQGEQDGQEVRNSNVVDGKEEKRKKKKDKKKSNSKIITVDGNNIPLKGFIKEYKELVDGAPKLNKFQRKAIRRYHREEALKPYQAELIRLQKYLEVNNRRMIILFEGRDAAGKPPN
ncbi:MAG: hypothetical protein D3925_07980, partial [Candidatus Electrothrix sp. AR5]|nr:hypothetical protein [Candidatus Electrothrix sp. AR5]